MIFLEMIIRTISIPKITDKDSMKTHVDGTACFMYGAQYIRQPINKNIQFSIPGKVKDIVYKMWWSHPDPKNTKN